MKKLIRVTTVPLSMRTLLRGQLKYMKNYYEVVAITSGGDCFDQMLAEQGNIRGIKVEMSRRITPLKDLRALWQLIHILRRERPFIVHTHTPKAGLLGMMAARIAGVPNRLHTVAGLPLLEASGFKRRVLNLVERVTDGCATRVYPNSRVLCNIMVENRLVNPAKMKVIANGSSNGIDTSFFSPDQVAESRAEIRKRLGIEENDLVFVFVGRVVRDKGINELLDAFRRLEQNRVKLLIVGDYERELDPISPENESYIADCPKICFVGFQQDVRPFFLAADILVFPSYREGFPNVVMQAGAMGLPSIVSDINGCNEIIEHGKNGLIVPPKNCDRLAEAMQKLLDDESLRETLARNSRPMICARYEQQVVWRELLAEYRSLE